MIASYEIVLTALKLSKTSNRENSKKITEHLCPALSKLGDELGNKSGQLGHEYLEEHTKELIEKLRPLLSKNIISKNNTFWSKWHKGFKISSEKLNDILKEIIPCESKKSDVFSTRKNHKLYSSFPPFKPKDSKKEIINSCESKKNDDVSMNTKLYSSLPYLDDKYPKEDKTNSCKDKKYHRSISKDDISKPILQKILTYPPEWDCISNLYEKFAHSEQDSPVLGEHLE